MESLYIFIISFTAIFLIYFFVFYLRGLKKHTIKNSMQVRYILSKQNLKCESISEKSIGIIICLTDALIISASGTIASGINLGYFWQLLIGFAILMMLIYSIYEIIGRIIKRKCEKNGKRKKN